MTPYRLRQLSRSRELLLAARAPFCGPTTTGWFLDRRDCARTGCAEPSARSLQNKFLRLCGVAKEVLDAAVIPSYTQRNAAELVRLRTHGFTTDQVAASAGRTANEGGGRR
jgi:hypothetical protein